MKNRVFYFVLTFTFLFLLGLSTFAETIEKEKGYISVNVSATKEMSPNQAELSISIETQNKSLKQASEENKLIANKVYSALKKLLKPEDYIKTGEYSVQPQYIYNNENKKTLDKYLVINTILIKTKNIRIISNLIDTSLAQGATNVDNLIFSTTDYDESCNELLASLSKKAYSQANLVAKSINSAIMGIKSIDASCSLGNTPMPMYKMMVGSSSASTPIESGKVNLYANINASFYVK